MCPVTLEKNQGVGEVLDQSFPLTGQQRATGQDNLVAVFLLGEERRSRTLGEL